MSPGGPNNMGRPLPKTFQSNTIVPNKSTMVEDDDSENGDEFGLDNVVAGLARRDTGIDGSSAEDQERIRAQEAELANLKDQLLEREQEIGKLRSSGSDDLRNLREELEHKHLDAQKLNDELRRELDNLHREKNQDEREIRAQHDRTVEDIRSQLDHSQHQRDDAHGQLEDLRAQLDNAHSQTDGLHEQLQTHQAVNEELRSQLQAGGNGSSDSEYERRIELLQQELASQQKLTKEVRDEATMLLHEMRDLSRQNDEAIEQEERLAAQVARLQSEIEEWRQRYAKVKAQNKSLRASQLGLGLQTSFDAGSLMRREGLTSEDGLVKDVDVAHFQMSIEELLKVARQTNTEAMLETVKNVAICVQAITAAVGTDGYPTPSPSPLSPDGGAQPPSVSKLKAQVTGTANSLITATKHHASGSGLSPVALLDAQASNLTSSVVELVKAVGIRPSPKSELEDAEYEHVDAMNSYYDDQPSPIDDTRNAPPVDDTRHAPPVEFLVSPPEPPPKDRPAGLGTIGRSNTFKKMNGWFGWGNKAGPNADDPPATPTLDAHTTEYDPYAVRD